MQRRSRGLNAGLILLLSQIFQVGVNNIPPVTLATLAVNIWFFLSPLKPLLSSCLSVQTCYQEKDWQRLLLSPLHHADDWHLYFNMVSMLWKGIQLERRLGSRWFAYVITTFSLLTGVVYLFLESALAEFMDEPGFKRNCAVGFSGVLFALKVLNNHYCPGGFVNVLGFPVPQKFACWAELVAIHLISPGFQLRIQLPTEHSTRCLCSVVLQASQSTHVRTGLLDSLPTHVSASVIPPVAQARSLGFSLSFTLTWNPSASPFTFTSKQTPSHPLLSTTAATSLCQAAATVHLTTPAATLVFCSLCPFLSLKVYSPSRHNRLLFKILHWPLTGLGKHQTPSHGTWTCMGSDFGLSFQIHRRPCPVSLPLAD